MTVLRDRQKAVQEALAGVYKGYYKAVEQGKTEKVIELGLKRANLVEQERDIGNAIGLKIITTKGFNPKRTE
jgi:hypothetical protein